MGRQHRLNLTVDAARIVLVCDQDDLFDVLGEAPTPTEVAQAADKHWGNPVGWWS